MTNEEQTRMRDVEHALHQAQGHLTEVFGEDVEPEFVSLIFGLMMAAIDATFAIRDGGTWRGLSDPKEIAAKLLRDSQLGE